MWWSLRVVEGPGGEMCLAVVPTGVHPSPPPQVSTWEDTREALAAFDDNGVAWDACPEPGPASEPALDPAYLAARYWVEVVRPPSPAPLHIAPGYSITGLPVYLEIGGDPSPQWTLDNPIGADIVISATPRYVVDWDDGATTDTISTGRPYPGGPGQITHNYRYVGDKVVTVSAYWTGRWHLAGEGATSELPELSVPTVATLDLPVRQLQAVRLR